MQAGGKQAWVRGVPKRVIQARAEAINHKSMKWSDAMKHCATYGKTLCGSSDAARCQNKGCYYNSIYQWTNEPCEPGDAGYECTTP